MNGSTHCLRRRNPTNHSLRNISKYTAIRSARPDPVGGNVVLPPSRRGVSAPHLAPAAFTCRTELKGRVRALRNILKHPIIRSHHPPREADVIDIDEPHGVRTIAVQEIQRRGNG